MGGADINRSLQLTDRERVALEDYARRVDETLGVNLVALKLFGSKAAGHAAPDSDLDVLIHVREAEASIEDRVLDVALEVNFATRRLHLPARHCRGHTRRPAWRQTGFVQALLRDAVLL